MTDYTGDLKEGDRFRFEKATVEARKISKPELFQFSSSHKGKRIKCSKSGILYVDKVWDKRK